MSFEQQALPFSDASSGRNTGSFIARHNDSESRRTKPTARVRARRTDPDTSKSAAANAVRFAGTHCDRILAALDKLGSATAHEVAKETGLSVVQVDRRRHELVKSGQVHLLTGPDGKEIERSGFNVMVRSAA